MTERKLDYNCRVELALDRLERRIYSLNYDGYFTKSFFNEFEEVLGLVAAFRLFFLDSEVKIHAYHSVPNVLRDVNSNEMIDRLLESFQSVKIGNEFSIKTSDCPIDEYPGAKSKIEIKVCSCDEYCSLVSCDNSTQCENGAISDGLIILYGKEKSCAFDKFFKASDRFKELQDLFKKNEEPKCFGKLTECKKVCSKWKNRCFTKKNTDNILTSDALNLDAVVQQLREKFQEVLTREVVADGQADVPVLLYNPKTRFLIYRATNYLEYPKRDDWNKFKAEALNIEPICIKTAVSLPYDLLESKKKINDQKLEKNEVKRLQTKIDDYIKAHQEEYHNITTKLQNCSEYKVFCEETIEDAKKLIAATIQRVDTGLTRDVWGSFENFSVPSDAKFYLDEITGASEKLRDFYERPFFKESEKLREFCECLFFKKTDDRKKQSYVITPLGYLGQKIGMIFTVLDEQNVKDCERKFNNIAREFASLLFRSLQAQAYRKTLSLLDVRHPKEALNILCEVLPLVFNITAIVFHMAGNEKSIYGFPSANEGEIFDRLDESPEHKIVTNTLIESNFIFAGKHAYEVRSYSNEGDVYSSEQYVKDGPRKIRTRSRLLLDIYPEKQKNLPIKKGTLDIFFDLSDYSLRRNAPDIVREIVFIADLIFEAACQKHAVMQKSLKSAVSAIMGRNMSHNIGSHVLARYSSAAGRVGEQRTFNSAGESGKSACEWGVEDHRSVFLRYLQRRMDFVAEVATAEKSFWTQPLSLCGVLSALNLDAERTCINKKKDRVEKRTFEPILLSYITGKEGIKACVVMDDNLKNVDPYFACPGGEVGAHALYVILENIIRNSARHNKNLKRNLIKLHVKVEEAKNPDLWCVTIIDDQTMFDDNRTLFEKVEEINGIISTEPILNQDGSPNPKYWGIREMQVCAHYLRGLPMSDLEAGTILPQVLEAFAHDNGDGTKCRLAYQIYLQRAKLCALICPKTPDLINEHKEFIKSKGIEIFDAVPDIGLLKGYSHLVIDSDIAKISVNKKTKNNELKFNGKDPIPLWQLPVRTSVVEGPFIQELLNALPHNFNPEDQQEYSSQKFNPEDWLEPLHKRIWKKYRDRLGRGNEWLGKPIRALVGWQEKADNIIEEGDCPNQLFCHALKGPNSDFAYKVFGNSPSISDQRLNCAWIDHGSGNDFQKEYQNPNLLSAAVEYDYGQPFVFAEILDSQSPHKPFLEKQRNKPETGNELVAAALARVIVLDERVQNELQDQDGNPREYRSGIHYESLWPCMGIWVPKKDQVDLNRPDFEMIKSFLKAPTQKSDHLLPDFLVLHLTILENLKGPEHECEAETLKELLRGTSAESDCEIVIVTGRGVPSLNRHDGDSKILPTRYLPISALLGYLLARPSKLAVMRALWSAAAAS